MKIKTSEATNTQINWLVATCEGAGDDWHSYEPFFWDGVAVINVQGHDVNYRPSTNWAQSGPIIEREEITLDKEARMQDAPVVWLANCGRGFVSGPTPLIAAMRCYVASKMGDEVDVPEELT